MEFTSKATDRIDRFMFRLRQEVPVLAVFLGCVALTLMTWYHARQNVAMQDRFRFEEVTNTIQDSVADRMQVYVNMLEQARSTFMLDENVTPEEWRNYVAALRVETRYPGIQGLGFAKAVRPETLQEEINRLRRTPGLEEYRVWPEGERDLYFPITMLEPLDWRNQRALGYDMFAEPVRHQAMSEAIESGHTRMSSVVRLVQETEQDAQPGFLIYVPVFKAGMPLETKEQRTEALMGFVYAPFRTKDLFDGIFLRLRHLTGGNQVDFEILAPAAEDPTKRVTLYDHDQVRRANRNDPEQLSHRVQIHVAGRTLEIRIFSLPDFNRANDYLLPSTILVVGLLLALLLTRIFWGYTRQAENALKSERQLRLVTNSLPVLISYIDPNLKFRFNNKAYENWFAKSPEQLRNQSISAAIEPENFALVEPAIHAALGGQRSEVECELKLADGRTRACHASYIPDRGPHGRVKGVVGLVSDITDRKRNEEQAHLLVAATTTLHTSLEAESALKAFTETLVPQIADWAAVDILEGDESFTRVAAAHRDAEGRTALYDIAARFPEPKVHGDPYWRAMRLGEPQLIPIVPLQEVLNAPGTPREMIELTERIGIASAIVAPLMVRGRSLGALVLGRSRHDRPFDSDDLQFAVELARRASLAIENARLYREAQAANRSKDEFLATVSHELRTPMNVILGWLEILRTEKPQGAPLDQALTTLERNARVQIELINDLLDISRIISGKLQLSTRPMNIGEVVQLAVESVRPAARAKAIRLDTIRENDIPRIQADPDRLNQVLWNLLTNAIKFTPNGGSVEVRLKREEQGVRIEVSDTGQGIEPRFLPFVFDRFRQEDGSTTRHHGGLGIGLAIVRYLVELHGGSVSVESKGKGFGATFSVVIPVMPPTATDTLPLSSPAGAADDHRETAAAKAARGPTPLRDLDVLLVDDSPDVRALLTRVLSKAGANVHALASASEALEALKRGTPDVLLSDIGLPEMDGYELIRKIRANEVRKNANHLPAAALTAYAQTTDAEAAIAAGYDRHLPKPVGTDELIETVLTLVEMSPPPGAGVPMLHGL